MLQRESENTTAWVAVLKHGSVPRQCTALMMLATIEADRELVVPELMAALDHPTPQVRQMAAFALGKRKVVEALPRLQALLHDRSKSVRGFAGRAIDAIQGSSDSAAQRPAEQ